MKRLSLAIAAVAGLVAYRRRSELRDVPASLPADERRIRFGPDLEVATYWRGPAEERPVLLVHSVNAAASAAEMRPLFDRLSKGRQAVALDLPGFGRSSRPPIEYTPAVMTDGIIAVLDALDEPADVVALSLGCEFAARGALQRPEAVRSLTLISPTGLGADQARSRVRWLGAAVRAPIIGEAIFAMLASRVSIGYFLAQSFRGPVDVDLANRAQLTSRHPNARFAVASFLEQRLFTSSAIKELYDPLTVPVLVIADQDPYSDFGLLPGLLLRRATWRHERLAPHRGLPHFDRPEPTFEAIASFQAG